MLPKEKKIILFSADVLTKAEIVSALTQFDDDTPIKIRVDELSGGAKAVSEENGVIVISD